ncbi:MAG: zf-HC2 domain-containing protein [Propionibacteriaceae bacterium]|jgi:anti-sigma factor (TIGR02949 family)|nr:zf-HC2 domain-containing protein [Propionibacteriaceae bacterium]
MVDLADTCSFVMMRINALLDGELDEETADQVREHLVNCAECNDEAELWSLIRLATRHALAPGQAPASLADRVTTQIRRLGG